LTFEEKFGKTMLQGYNVSSVCISQLSHATEK